MSELKGLFELVEPWAPALLSLLLAWLTGLFFYSRQKKMDRENELLQQRRAIYIDYLKEVQLLQSVMQTSAEISFSDSEVKAWRSYAAQFNIVQLIAPDGVLKCVEEHDKILVDTQKTFLDSDSEKNDFDNICTLEAEVRARLISEMRVDIFRDTKFRKSSVAPAKVFEFNVC